MKPGDKVRVKSCPRKELFIAKLVRGPFGKAARCVDKDNVYIGQFYLNTLDKV
jgi:hypothetical protein